MISPFSLSWLSSVFMLIFAQRIIAFSSSPLPAVRAMASSSSASASRLSMHRPAAALTSSYPALTTATRDLVLERVAVIHRHGDRAQIARTLGSAASPYATVSEEVQAHWQRALPSEESLSLMQRVARHGLVQEPYRREGESEVERGDPLDLYTGWDKENKPFSQLTEIGVQQLKSVGRTLRERYGEKVLPRSREAALEKMFCRSTNICRTVQSLRALLVGIFEKELESKRWDESVKDDKDLPFIHTRPRPIENLIPQVDGDCPAMSSRRAFIFPHDLHTRCVANYAEFEQRIKSLLGYEDRVNWLAVKEVLTCHHVHGIKQLKGIEESDVHKATEIAGWTWGVLYKDDHLNKFAIGRFVEDLLHDLSEEGSDDASHAKGKSFLVYSGHDSTLVPILCALGVYDDVWPEYGAYLCFEIAKHSVTGKRFVRVVYNENVMQLGSVPSTPFPDATEPFPAPSMASFSADSSNENTENALTGWYEFDDFARFLGRIRIHRDAYAVESKVHFHPAGTSMSEKEIEEAEDEAAKESADDLSATFAADPPAKR